MAVGRGLDIFGPNFDRIELSSMLRPSQNLVNITAPVVEILAFPFVRVCGKTVCESLY